MNRRIALFLIIGLVMGISAVQASEIVEQDAMVLLAPMNEESNAAHAEMLGMQVARASENSGGVAVQKPPEKVVKEKEAFKITVVPGVWQEGDENGTKLTLYYLAASYDVIEIRGDYYNINGADDLYRLRLHSYKIPVVNGDDVKVSVQPGALFDTNSTVFYGGKVNLGLPKLGTAATFKSYGGGKVNRNEIFATQKIYKPVSAMYYRFYAEGSRPKSVLGPKVDIGKNAYIFYGWSTNDSGFYIWNVGGKITF